MDLLLVRKNITFNMPTGEKREIPCLLPAFLHQYDAIKKLPMNRVIDCRAKVSRNAKLNQKFWAITNFVFDTLPEGYAFKSIDQFVDFVKIEVGFVDSYTVNGKVRMYPRSIAFANCTEDEFQHQFYEPALVLYSQILGMPVPDLEMASLEYDGPDYRSSRGK